VQRARRLENPSEGTAVRNAHPKNKSRRSSQLHYITYTKSPL
jgi:hypothetical protein